MMLVTLLFALTGCAPLGVQIAALKFAQGVGDRDLVAVRERSSARLNREVWDELDPKWLDKLRETPGMSARPKADVRLVETFIKDDHAVLRLRITPEKAEPMDLRVELKDEGNWRVDDIVVNPEGDALSLRALAGCFVTMQNFAEGLQRRDFDLLRRVSTADLRERVVDEAAKLDLRVPERHSPARPDVAQERFHVGADAAEFVWRVDRESFAYRLKREDGAWRIDDVHSPGGSLKLMLIAGFAALRLLTALSDGDRDGVRAGVTEEFWTRAVSRIPAELYEAIRGPLKAGKGDGTLAGWPVVVESDGRIRLSVDFGLQRLDVDVVDRRVDDIRLGGVSVAEHLDIATVLIAFAQAFVRGERETLVALSAPELADMWRGTHEESLAMVARFFRGRGPGALPSGAPGTFAIDGNSATLAVQDFAVTLTRIDERWKVASIKAFAYDALTIVPIADPVLLVMAGFDQRKVSLLREACTPALNRMAWDLIDDEMLAQALLHQVQAELPRESDFALTVGEKGAEIRLGAARAGLVRDGRWRLDDVIVRLEGKDASLARALGVAAAAWRFADALRRGDLAELKREASARLRTEVFDKVALENQKEAVGKPAAEFDLAGAKLGSWELPAVGAGRVEIALSGDRSVRFLFDQEGGRYRVDDCVLRAGQDELSLRKAVKIGVAFGR